MFINKKFTSFEKKIDRKLKEKISLYGREKCKKYGIENSDSRFMLIRRNDECGLGSYLVTNLRYIARAVEQKMIPVIDMKNYSNAYNTKQTIHKVNVWEYYFEQPFPEYTLDMVYKSAHVKLTDIRITEPMKGEPELGMNFFGSEEAINKYRKIAHKYIRLNENTKNKVMQEYHRIISKNDYVLGVVLRGTDYTTLHPAGHPVQPSVEEAIAYCKKIMKEKNCTKLFLATEDKKIYDCFKKNFGNLLVINEKRFIEYQGGYIAKYKFNRENDGYLRGLEYLITMYILSMCNCLVAGRCGASVVATFLAKGYDYAYYWDLGEY